jgi:hypothetical protein
MYSTHYSCHILMKLKFSRQTFEKSSHTKFNENPPCGSRVVRCGHKWRSWQSSRSFVKASYKNGCVSVRMRLTSPRYLNTKVGYTVNIFTQTRCWWPDRIVVTTRHVTCRKVSKKFPKTESLWHNRSTLCIGHASTQTHVKFKGRFVVLFLQNSITATYNQNTWMSSKNERTGT